MWKPIGWATLTAVCLASAGTAGKYNPTLSVGDKAPEWSSLPGVDGKKLSLADLEDKKVVVLAFTCNSCPYAVDYEDRMIAFSNQMKKEGKPVELVAVNVNKLEEDALPAMKKKSEEKSFNFPYLFDETQQIAKDYGATRTPEFFVLDADRKVTYMGAFDDNTDPEQVNVRYIADAVEAALKGKPASVAETPPIGCAIRIERTRRSRNR